MIDLYILKITITIFIIGLCMAATPEMHGSKSMKNLVRFIIYLAGFVSILNLWLPTLFGYIYLNYYH